MSIIGPRPGDVESKCSTECIDDMAVYTLYKDSEGTSVRRLDGKMAIEVQDEMGLELR